MTDEPVREVLCIPGNGRKYAVEFSYVEEICKDVVLSAMPCLPGYYAGVCNHKGTIVPVVRLEGCIENCIEGCIEPDSPGFPVDSGETFVDRQLVMVIHWKKYYAGILLHGDPYMAQLKAEDRIQGPEKQEAALLAEKAYYMCGNELYFLLDVEKALENLIVCR